MEQVKYFSEFFNEKITIGILDDSVMFNKQEISNLFSLKHCNIKIPVSLKSQANNVSNPLNNTKFKGSRIYINLQGLLLLLHKNMKNTEEFFSIQKCLFEIYFRSKFLLPNVNKTINDYIIQNDLESKKNIIIDEKNITIDEKKTYEEKLYIIIKLSENTLLIKKKTVNNISKIKKKNYDIIFAHKNNLYKTIIDLSNSHYQLFNKHIVKKSDENNVLIIKSSFTFEKDILPLLIQMGFVNQM